MSIDFPIHISYINFINPLDKLLFTEPFGSKGLNGFNRVIIPQLNPPHR